MSGNQKSNISSGSGKYGVDAFISLSNQVKLKTLDVICKTNKKRC